MIKREAMGRIPIPVMEHLGAGAVHADGSGNKSTRRESKKIQGSLPLPIKRCELGVTGWSAG